MNDPRVWCVQLQFAEDFFSRKFRAVSNPTYPGFGCQMIEEIAADSVGSDLGELPIHIKFARPNHIKITSSSPPKSRHPPREVGEARLPAFSAMNGWRPVLRFVIPKA